MRSLEKVLRRTEAALGSAGIPWALLGGWAISVRTEPRFTRDVDLAVAVRADGESESVVRLFRSMGYDIAGLVEQDAAHRLATVRLEPMDSSSDCLLDLLFASSGIEPEVCAQAERIEVLPGLIAPVAQTGHLIALKLLSRDDRTRPQDAGDLRALLRIASAADLVLAREALTLISARGFDRGRDLKSALDDARGEFGA